MPHAPSKRRHYKQLGLAQLRSYCAVCDLGGYAAAARALRLTSPAVWEQVQALERHFGARLLSRDGNRVHPTAEGKRLRELVQPILAGLESIPDVLRQWAGGAPGQLTIVTNLRVLVDEVSRAMADFQGRQPEVRLCVRYVGSEQVVSHALDASSSVLFTLEPAPDEPLPNALEYEPAAELDYLLATPPGHPLARRKSLRLEAIVEHPLVLVLPHGYSRHRVQEVFHQHNLTGRMKVAVEASSDEYTLACVRAGLGVGIVVGKPGGTLHHGLAVRPLRRWFGTARVGFLWRRGAYVPPLERMLADCVAQYVSGT